MGRIYRGAEEVLAWVGEASDGSNELIDILETTGSWAESQGMLQLYESRELWNEQVSIFQLAVTGKISPKESCTDAWVKTAAEYRAFCDKMVPRYNVELIKALEAWYKRPWFTRVWMLQEFALASRVVFITGHKRITAEQLSLSKLVFQTMISQLLLEVAERNVDSRLLQAVIGITDADTTKLFITARRRLQVADDEHGQGDTLYRVLQLAFVENHLEAGLPRDTIYGLLSLAPKDAERFGIQPDMDADVHTLYTRVARSIIESGDIELLLCCQYPKEDDTLPSWVPDWRSRMRTSFAWQPTRSSQSKSDKPLFTASGEALPEIFGVDNERQLGIMGYVVDSIEKAGGPWDSEERDLCFLAQIRQLCHLSAAKPSSESLYASPQRRAEAIWRTPIGDILRVNTDDAVRASPAVFSAYEETLLHALGDESVNYRVSMHKMTNKRPFLSRLGYVGIGPKYLQPGDVIVVLTRSSLPYVARPTREGRYRLVGECYCDGIMDGEIVGLREKERIILE